MIWTGGPGGRDTVFGAAVVSKAPKQMGKEPKMDPKGTREPIHCPTTYRAIALDNGSACQRKSVSENRLECVWSWVCRYGDVPDIVVKGMYGRRSLSHASKPK